MAVGTKVMRASVKTRLRRVLRFARTRARELRMIGKALASTKHPILVHIIPMRQCNLACTYCNEYDDFSKPVPLPEMKKRLDLLADMGTSIITISGGEPLMHPELDEVIRHMRRRGMIAGLITNGFYLNRERIERLNEAGLEHLQISIDNVVPDDVSKKSLKTLDGRLEMLAQYTPEMRHREYFTEKFCAARCTVSCVQQVGILDNWRGPQNLKPIPMTPPAPQAQLVQIGQGRGDS